MRLTVRGRVALVLSLLLLVLVANHALGLDSIPSECP